MELNVWTVVSLALVVASAIFGVYVLKVKDKGQQALSLVKEAVEVAETVIKAAEDNTFDPVEIENIKKEVADVKSAYRTLLGKE
jgi:formylmethanofuran dehydrogenase subunit E